MLSLSLSLSPLSVFLSFSLTRLTAARGPSQLLLITTIPGSPSHVSSFTLVLGLQLCCSAPNTLNSQYSF